MDVASPQNAILRRPWIRSHDESRPILLPLASAASHSDGNRRHKRGPNHVLKHCRYNPEAVRVEDEECEGGLQLKPPSREEAKASRHSIATTVRRGPNDRLL